MLAILFTIILREYSTDRSRDVVRLAIGDGQQHVCRDSMICSVCILPSQRLLEGLQHEQCKNLTSIAAGMFPLSSSAIPLWIVAWTF